MSQPPTRAPIASYPNEGDAKLALRLDAALNNISQGLCFFDGSHRLIICNNRYIDMYGLPADRVRPGVSLRDIVNMRVEAGGQGAVAAEVVECGAS